MSSSTPNLNLVLPVGSEHVSRSIINENNTKIDTGFGTLSEQIGNYVITYGTSATDVSKRLNNIDLNTAKEAGRYYINSGCTNKPYNSGGYMDVYAYDAHYIKQVIYKENAEETWERTCYNDSWSSWQRFETIKNTPNSITDFNDAKMSGYYKAIPSTTNGPSSGYWAVDVLPYSANDLGQIAIEVNNGKMYIRTLHDGTTWTAWQQLATTTPTSETITPTGGTIEAGSVKYSAGLHIINIRFKASQAITAGSNIVTLPFSAPNTASVSLSNNKGYAIDILGNKIRSNNAIATNEVLVISGVVAD